MKTWIGTVLSPSSRPRKVWGLEDIFLFAGFACDVAHQSLIWERWVRAIFVSDMFRSYRQQLSERSRSSLFLPHARGTSNRHEMGLDRCPACSDCRDSQSDWYHVLFVLLLREEQKRRRTNSACLHCAPHGCKPGDSVASNHAMWTKPVPNIESGRILPLFVGSAARRRICGLRIATGPDKYRIWPVR